MKPDVAMDMVFINQHSLKIYLKDAGVVTRTNTRVSEIVENGVRVINEHGEQELIEADVVVAAFGMRKNDALLKQLRALMPDVIAVGDCDVVKNIKNANQIAFNMALEV